MLHSSRSLSYVLWCNNLFLIRIDIKLFIPEQLSFSFRMWILGHDTTASAICWAIYSLGKYQDLQEKVYQELMQVLGDRQKLQWYVDIIEWFLINVFWTVRFIKVPGIVVTGRIWVGCDTCRCFYEKWWGCMPQYPL